MEIPRGIHSLLDWTCQTRLMYLKYKKSPKSSVIICFQVADELLVCWNTTCLSVYFLLSYRYCGFCGRFTYDDKTEMAWYCVGLCMSIFLQVSISTKFIQLKYKMPKVFGDDFLLSSFASRWLTARMSCYYVGTPHFIRFSIIFFTLQQVIKNWKSQKCLFVFSNSVLSDLFSGMLSEGGEVYFTLCTYVFFIPELEQSKNVKNFIIYNSFSLLARDLLVQYLAGICTDISSTKVVP